MGVYPLEGYEIICDKCEESELFLENPDHVSSLEIDSNFDLFVEGLKSKGWIISDREVLCPGCASKTVQG